MTTLTMILREIWHEFVGRHFVVIDNDEFALMKYPKELRILAGVLERVK